MRRKKLVIDILITSRNGDKFFWRKKGTFLVNLVSSINRNQSFRKDLHVFIGQIFCLFSFEYFTATLGFDHGLECVREAC